MNARTSAAALPARSGRWVYAIVFAAMVVRAVLATLRRLTPDEAYYLCAARRGALAWPIPDHPPAIGALLATADHLFPGPIELRVRLVSIVLQAVTALGVARLAAELAPRRGADPLVAATVAAALATWMLLPTAGGLIATPDAPLLAALAWLLVATFRQQRSALDDFAALGLTAIALASKVSALALVAPLALHAAATRDGRRVLTLVCGAALGLAFALPSLRMQLAHAIGLGPAVTAPNVGPLPALGALLASQLALWTPPVVWIALRASRRLPRAIAFACAVLVGALVLSAIVSGRAPEPNWIAPAALPLLAIAAVDLSVATRSSRRVVLAIAVLPTVAAIALWIAPPILPAGRDPLARAPHGDAPLPSEIPPYGVAAWRCVYASRCADIDAIFVGYDVALTPMRERAPIR